MTLGVRGVAIDKESRVLLIRHSYVPGWYLPGGGVEAGETMGEALVREMREECSIALTGPAELFGLYLNRAVSKRDHVGLYVCRDWTRAAWSPGREIVEAGFFARDALPKGTTPGTIRRLNEVFDRLKPAEEW